MVKFAPHMPLSLQGTLSNELVQKAQKLSIESARLSGNYPQQILDAIKELLLIVNSYYSNLIESEGTHPHDIQKAMKKEYALDEKNHRLQLLAIAYIDMQKELAKTLPNKETSPYSTEFIRYVHKAFYGKEEMQPFLRIAHPLTGATILMTPGAWREHDVKVGVHIPPTHSEVAVTMQHFEHLYKRQNYDEPLTHEIIKAFASHHRLVWIHPFLDGNGRVSRLILDALLHAAGVEGYGLWSISRGLAKHQSVYKKELKYADMIRQGATDGRGPLSLRGLESFVDFMLETALDQVAYTASIVKMQTLSTRIENYVKYSLDGMYEVKLPKESAVIFKELLLKGELIRSDIDRLLKISESKRTKLLRELIQKDFLSSTSHKSPVKLKFNTHFAQEIFPDLIPKK